MKKILFALLIIANILTIQAQGCSDAGICSAGNSFHPESTTKNSIEIGSIFGSGEADVKYFSPYLTYTRNFNDRFAVSVKAAPQKQGHISRVSTKPGAEMLAASSSTSDMPAPHASKPRPPKPAHFKRPDSKPAHAA